MIGDAKCTAAEALDVAVVVVALAAGPVDDTPCGVTFVAVDERAAPVDDAVAGGFVVPVLDATGLGAVPPVELAAMPVDEGGRVPLPVDDAAVGLVDGLFTAG